MQKTISAPLAELPDVTVGLMKIGFPPDDMESIRALFSTVELRKVAAGEVVIHEWERTRDAYLIHKGVLEVWKLGGGRTGAKIRELGPGNIVGEMSVMTGGPRSAAVKAKDDAEVFVLTPAVFHAMLSASPAFKAHMQALVAARKKELGSL